MSFKTIFKKKPSLDKRIIALENELDEITNRAVKDNRFCVCWFDIFKEQLEKYYDTVYDITEGVYKIKKDNKFGLADKTGKIIQKPKYDFIHARNIKGLIKVENEKKIGYLNIKGVEVIPPKYSIIENEKDGLF